MGCKQSKVASSTRPSLAFPVEGKLSNDDEIKPPHHEIQATHAAGAAKPTIDEAATSVKPFQHTSEPLPSTNVLPESVPSSPVIPAPGPRISFVLPNEEPQHQNSHPDAHQLVEHGKQSDALLHPTSHHHTTEEYITETAQSTYITKISTTSTTTTVTSLTGPGHLKLPPNTVEAVVRNVYDGDTLTLSDGRRVRFLGIDSPEIKEKEPFAVEARDFVRKLCPNGSIVHLEVDEEEKDRYDRLLRYVYVCDVNSADPTDMKCVNLEILANGFGRYYSPSAAKLVKADELLKAAQGSRLARRGIWATFDDTKIVRVTRLGKAFHNEGCEHLAHAFQVMEITTGEAVDSGRSACRTCAP